jgi:hypothetical protein
MADRQTLEGPPDHETRAKRISEADHRDSLGIATGLVPRLEFCLLSGNDSGISAFSDVGPHSCYYLHTTLLP